MPKAWISQRLGGDQIDYVDERPAIRKIFADEPFKTGVTSAMDAIYEAELTDLPSASASASADGRAGA